MKLNARFVSHKMSKSTVVKVAIGDVIDSRKAVN